MIRYQFLPHYFKFIGLGLFLSILLTHFIGGFIDGLTSPFETTTGPESLKFLEGPTSEIISFLSILLYALSRDKIFDELMVKMRMETLYFVFVLTLLFHLGQLTNLFDNEIAASKVIQYQVLAYILLNSLRKRLLPI